MPKEQKAQEAKRARLGRATVAVIGLGSLGATAATELATAGIGRLILFDHDSVSAANLRAQPLFGETDIGRPKVEVVAEALVAISRNLRLEQYKAALAPHNVQLIAKADVLLDCTDNMFTKLLLNDISRAWCIPLVHAAIGGALGQLYVVTPDRPCLRCALGSLAAQRCGDGAAVSRTAAALAQLQVSQALRLLLGQRCERALFRLDVQAEKIRALKVGRDLDCPACAGRYLFLKPITEFRVERCDSKAALSAKPTRQLRLDLTELTKRFETVGSTPIVAVVAFDGYEIVCHSHGELIFKNCNEIDRANEIAATIYGIAAKPA